MTRVRRASSHLSFHRPTSLHKKLFKISNLCKILRVLWLRLLRMASHSWKSRECNPVAEMACSNQGDNHQCPSNRYSTPKNKTTLPSLFLKNLATVLQPRSVTSSRSTSRSSASSTFPLSRTIFSRSCP